MDIPPQLVAGAVGALFGAGAAWGARSVKNAKTHKDVNALGGCYRRDRWNDMLWRMTETEKREDREKLRDLHWQR